MTLFFLDWYIDPSQPMSGFTATSRSTCEEVVSYLNLDILFIFLNFFFSVEFKDEVAYFSQPFEFMLSYQNNEIDLDKRGKLNKFYYKNVIELSILSK